VKKRRYSAGGGVPVTGGGYNAVAPQYPFPSVPGGDAGATNNMSVTVAGQEVGICGITPRPGLVASSNQFEGQILGVR